MADSPLYKKLCQLELNNKSPFYRKVYGRAGIDEIKNHRSSQLPPQPPENKVFKDALAARLLGVYFIWPFIIFMAMNPKTWWFYAAIVLFLLLVAGIGKSLEILFITHIIEISSKGLRVEKDRYSWTQIEGVFIMLRPGRYQTYKLVIAAHGGKFKTYDLRYYMVWSSDTQEAIRHYITPHLPLSD
ncbi:hypothetical protein [Chitinophaga sp.]|uniref:hypothetical protein n=1 Tax=Chitinophaga sp. TaxID=1869181 RepID=UPI0031D42AB2